MPYTIITIPVLDSEKEIEKLNGFIQSHKVIEVEKQVVQVGKNSYWTFCVQYLLGNVPNRNNLKYPEKTDYKELLSEEEFKRFAHFRNIRKQLATDEAIPAFTIFTDAELAEMAKQNPLTENTMQGIKGIGEKKMQKYADKFIKS